MALAHVFHNPTSPLSACAGELPPRSADCPRGTTRRRHGYSDADAGWRHHAGQWNRRRATLRRWTGTGGIGLRLGGEGQVLGFGIRLPLLLDSPPTPPLPPMVSEPGRGQVPG